MKLFDPKSYHLHTQRAKKTFHAHNFLFEHVGQELVSRLQDLKKTFKKALNLSPHPLPYIHTNSSLRTTHHLGEGKKSHKNDVFLWNKLLALDCFAWLAMTRRVKDGRKKQWWHPNQTRSSLRAKRSNPVLTPHFEEMQPFLNFSSLKNHPHLEEKLPYSEASFDLILSCLQSHWVNDLTGLLKSIHSSLESEGLYLGALWGGQTLFELRESLLQAELQLTGGASPRMAPLLHPADAPQLLSRAGFFSPVVDTEAITVTYPTLSGLLKDLRGMGETNKLYDRQKSFTSKRLFEKAEEIYLSTFGNPDHTLPATFEVLYLTGWKR